MDDNSVDGQPAGIRPRYFEQGYIGCEWMVETEVESIYDSGPASELWECGFFDPATTNPQCVTTGANTKGKEFVIDPGCFCCCRGSGLDEPFTTFG